MSFVFPIMLGGISLVAVPLLIHLVMRQKPRTLQFPAFRFLAQRHKTNTRKLRLRHLLLLLLRMLLLVLVFLAASRPLIRGDRFNLSADRPVAAVLVFDTSYSMEYKMTGGRSRLDEARERGQQLIDKLPPGSKFIVLDTAEPVLTDREEWLTPAAARQRIRTLKLRYDSDSVTRRLQDAYPIFARVAAAGPADPLRRLPRLLGVFSDATRNCWDATLLTTLYDRADQVPTPLEQLRPVEGTVAARVALLEQLRDQLPPPDGVDYPEQSLIDAWQELREQIPQQTALDYPTKEIARAQAAVRASSRELLRTLRGLDGEGLSEEAKGYRREVIDSLEDGLGRLRGAYSLFVNVGVAEPVDLAVLQVDLPRVPTTLGVQQLFPRGQDVTLRCVLQASGKDADASVVCAVGDRNVPATGEVAAGQKAILPVEVGTAKLPPGPHQAEVRLTAPDLLDFNNRQYVTFAVRSPRDVLIVADNPADASVWERALLAYQQGGAFQPFRKTTAEVAGWDAERLHQFAAVYLFNVADPPPKLWAALRGYVDRGGRLGVIPPARPPQGMGAYNDNETARELLPGAFESVVGETKPGAVWDWKEGRIYQHPMLEPVRQWVQQRTADFVDRPSRAYYYWKVRPDPKADVLVSYADGEKTPAVLEKSVGAAGGRVLLLTTRLDRGQDPPWNNYLESAPSSFVVALPILVTKYLAGGEEQLPMNYVSGREVPKVAVPPSVTDTSLTLLGPGLLEAVPRPADGNEVAFKNLSAPGNYRVEDKARRVVGAFSVNMPPEESDLRPVPLVDIEDLLGPGAVVAPDHTVDLREQLQGHLAEPVQALPLLLLGLLVFLALENLLANLFYRSRGPQPAAGGAP